MSVTRTIEIDDLSPFELATLFASMDGRSQALFFAGVWQIAKDWPGAGWCQQSCGIVSHLNKDGRDAVAALAEHLALAEAA